MLGPLSELFDCMKGRCIATLSFWPESSSRLSSSSSSSSFSSYSSLITILTWLSTLVSAVLVAHVVHHSSDNIANLNFLNLKGAARFFDLPLSFSHLIGTTTSTASRGPAKSIIENNFGAESWKEGPSTMTRTPVYFLSHGGVGISISFHFICPINIDIIFFVCTACIFFFFFLLVEMGFCCCS